jgi:hypothetical protein
VERQHEIAAVGRRIVRTFAERSVSSSAMFSPRPYFLMPSQTCFIGPSTATGEKTVFRPFFSLCMLFS